MSYIGNIGIFFLLAIIAKDAYSLSISISPGNEIVVKSGEEITMICQTGQQLEGCSFDVPREDSSFSLNPSKPPYQGISYAGKGLEAGQCGLRLERVLDKHNGVFTCTLTAKGAVRGYKANITVIVAKTPNSPELSVSRGKDGIDTHFEGDLIIASCAVNNGRPAANLSWYIGDDKITEGLGMPEIDEVHPATMFNVRQNLTRRAQASDNGKALKCVASHPLLNVNKSTAQRLINVRFAPKAQGVPIERFGLVEGEDGKVDVTVHANPRPVFTWFVNNEKIHEGNRDSSERYEHMAPTQNLEKGPAYWTSTLIIRNLMKEDVEREYRLLAENNMGRQSYIVKISTNPEPKMLSLGIGTIFGIVVAVLLILTITSVLVFARAKGRWCFAGGPTGGDEPEKVPEGNVNPAAHTNSSEYINGSPELKKPKEDTPV